jgi:hypothetical protein
MCALGLRGCCVSDGHFGELKDARILDFFFGHMQRNDTPTYQEQYPFISYRMHEHYFTR